jgi:high-affinity iron transporter
MFVFVLNNLINMFAALIITLRETLEAALVTGIALAYLKKTKNEGHLKFVWAGVLAGIIFSILMAYLFDRYFGGFEGKSEELYEGIMMISAGVLITWMILWMLKQRAQLKKKLESKVASHIEKDHPWGIFTLVFVSVAREGIETVIFLKAAMIHADSSSVLLGAALGILLAILLSVVLFKGIAKVPMRKFFTASSILLILFAAGLMAHGVHEFQEAGVVPVIAEHIWDINPEVIVEGVYPVMHEKGVVGGLLKGLFGYNGNPNLLEVLVYGLYLIIIAGAWKKLDRV